MYFIKRIKKELGFIPNGHVGCIKGNQSLVFLVVLPFGVILGTIWAYAKFSIGIANVMITPLIALLFSYLIKRTGYSEKFIFRVYSSLIFLLTVFIACSFNTSLFYPGALKWVLYLSTFLAASNATIDYQ